MAFNINAYSRISGSANNSIVTAQDGTALGAPCVYSYISFQDNIATISAPDYFNPLASVLNVGDLFYIVGTDTNNFFTVTTVQVQPPHVTVATGVVTGDVSGPASSVDGDFVLFNGVTGKVIKDSGYKIVPATAGGTGVNNGTSTITIGGAVTFSGAFTFTGTLTANSAVTFPTSGTLATTSQLPTPAALTEVNDTNVTLTLGGTPATALLQAVSLTLGWTGQLSGTRGGTGVNNGASTITIGGNVTFSGAFTFTGTLTANTNVTFPTSGTLATTSQLPTGSALTEVNDTNVTLTLGGTPATALLQAVSLTLGWTGTLSGTRGGTGVNNGASTITIGGNVTFSGAFTFTGTLTANTNVTFPTSGTLATTSQLPSLPLSLANGGTGQNLTGAAYQFFETNSSSNTVLSQNYSNIRTINQTSHGLSVGNVVKLSGASTYATAQANSAANAESVGIVIAVIDANDFVMQFGGLVTGLSGLTVGPMYLDPAVAGGLTTTKPTTSGQVVKPVLIADTTTSGYWVNMLGVVL